MLHVFRHLDIWQRLIDYAPQPDGWPASVFPLIVTESQELWEQSPELRDDRLPLGIMVCPQDRVGVHDVVRVELGCGLQRPNECFDDCVACSIHSRYFLAAAVPAVSSAACFSASVRCTSLTRFAGELYRSSRTRENCALGRGSVSLPRSFFQWMFGLARKMPAPFFPPGQILGYEWADIESHAVVDVRFPSDGLLLDRLSSERKGRKAVGLPGWLTRRFLQLQRRGKAILGTAFSTLHAVLSA